MFLVDLEQGRIVDDEELKHADRHGQALRQVAPRVHGPAGRAARRRRTSPAPTTTRCSTASRRSATRSRTSSTSSARWATTARRRSARWAPTRRWPCSPTAPQPLFNYFKQLFAQVTNPPLDAIREELVTSVLTGAGGEGNLLDADARELPPDRARHADPRQRRDGPAQAARRLARVQVGRRCRCSSRPPRGRRAWSRRSKRCSRRPARRSTRGANLIILSDRGVDAETGRRSRRCWRAPGCTTTWSARGCGPGPGWSIECGDAREVHHFALLLGYGAGTINPYVAFETLDDMIRQGMHQGRIDHAEAVYSYRKAIKKGVVKVMSKMGISTIQSYRGAQIFEAIGLNEEFVEPLLRQDRLADRRRRPRRRSPAETLEHHHRAYAIREVGPPMLEEGGQYQWRRDGEYPPVQPRDRLPAPARHPGRPVRHLQEVHRSWSTSRTSGSARSAACSSSSSTTARRCRSRRSSRSSRSSSGSPPARCRYGSISGRGARDPGHRHEPPRRQEQHRRRGRGPRAVQAAAQRRQQAAARSSRWPRAGSA